MSFYNYDKYISDIEKIKKYNKKYYVDNEPAVTDYEYDKIYNDVVVYEKNNPDKKVDGSPTTSIGNNLEDCVEYPNKMWSLEDKFKIIDVSKWIKNKINKYPTIDSFLLEGKIDGLSLKLVYSDKKLLAAYTRGDGSCGHNVTDAARCINGIPDKIDLPGDVEINGEVYMSISVFENLNKINKKLNKKLFMNPRNAAAGTIRLSDTTEIKNRKLEFIPWEIVNCEKSINDLSGYGFNNNPLSHVVCNDDIQSVINNVKKYLKICSETRKSIDVPLDGVVIKITNHKLQNDIGYTSKYPKWACAFKFDPIEKATKILDIKYNISRYGKYTPIGILEPIILDGSRISKVTLYNLEFIKKMKIVPGSTITIIKSGDVIPKILTVLKNGNKELNIPNKCVYCGHNLINKNKNLYCVNKDCSGVLQRKLEHFVSRDCFNIRSLGKDILKRLIETGTVCKFSDIFNLRYEDLTKIGLGDRSIYKLLMNIDKSKNITLSKFIYSLSLVNVGKILSNKIADKFLINFLYLDVNTLYEKLKINRTICSDIVDDLRYSSLEIKKLLSIITIKG